MKSLAHGNSPQTPDASRLSPFEKRVQTPRPSSTQVRISLARSRTIARDTFEALPRPRSRRLPCFWTRTGQFFEPDDFTSRYSPSPSPSLPGLATAFSAVAERGLVRTVWGPACLVSLTNRYTFSDIGGELGRWWRRRRWQVGGCNQLWFNGNARRFEGYLPQLFPDFAKPRFEPLTLSNSRLSVTNFLKRIICPVRESVPFKVAF